MRMNLGAVLVCASLLPAFSVCCHAAGRTADPPNPLANSVKFSAWCRDGSIQAAVCNLGNDGQNVKVAVGTYDTTEHFFGYQSFPIEARTIKVVNFPVMTKPTPRGDTQQSDSAFLFVESGGDTVEVGCISIQRVYPKAWDASVDSYLAETGKEVTLTHKEQASDAMRMVFIAKTTSLAGVAGVVQMAEGSAQAMTTDTLKGLGLVPEAIATYSELLKDNYGFVIPAGKTGLINISYATGNVDGCKVAHVHIERHVVKPAGGTAGGMGPTFLVYDPKTVTLKPVLHLTTTEESPYGSLRKNEHASSPVPSGQRPQTEAQVVKNVGKN